MMMKLPIKWKEYFFRSASEMGEAINDEYVGRNAPRLFRLGIIAGVVLLVGLIGLGWFWSAEPDPFDVEENARLYTKGVREVRGSATTAALIHIMDTLLNKRGGFISNDIFPPGLWLDNIRNWEYGALIQARDLAKGLREAFSRSQTQSTEDQDLAMAESRFFFDNHSWALPASESEYREGLRYMRNYLKRLCDEDEYNAQFYARADNLRYWLVTVETRLGSLSQRLSASVGQRRMNTDLAGDAAGRQATPAPTDLEIKTPWLEIDDIFYEARGTSWALIHLLRAVEIDFAEVLEKKNARVSLQQIIRELEATQQPMYSPVILNGSGFGVLANHSLVIASYISRANAAISDLRELLAQG